MTKARHRKSNTPLTPNSIPMTQTVVKQPRLSEDARKMRSPLDFTPDSWLTKIIQIPGIFIFCTLCGYVLGRFRLSFILLLPVMHVSYYIFKRRIAAYKRTIETLDSEKKRQEFLGEFETVEWMNHILKKFWDISEQTVSSIIFNEVNNIIMKQVSSKLPFEVRLSEITLGTRPPVVERISFVQNSENRLILDCVANFIPVEASEEILAYFKKERTHWNTYIEIQITLANLLKIPILVRDFTFSGVFRIELDLTQKIPFISKLKFAFIELPVVDFKLIPLKSVDMLDLPYVGRLIDQIMKYQITNMALLPKFIEIDVEEIAKYSGSIVGVIYVFVHDLESTDQSTNWVILDTNGRVIGSTSKKVGKNSVFNQGFYDIVTDATQYVGLKLKSSENETKLGKIWLRNLNKHQFSDCVHLSNEKSRVFLNVTTQFYPVKQERCDSAIINLNLISIEDLQCVGDPINRLYSTFCIVSLESREAVVNRSVVKKMESKRIFTTKDPFYNEFFRFFVRGFDEYIIKIQVMDEKDGRVMGSVVIPCVDVKDGEVMKYRISGVECGEMNLKFSTKYIDMTDMAITSNAEEIVEEVVRDVVAGPDHESTRLSEPQTSSTQTNSTIVKKTTAHHGLIGSYLEADHIEEDPEHEEDTKIEIPKLTLGIYSTTVPTQDFVNYTKACKLAIRKFDASGIFNIVFESEFLNVKMDPFCTDTEIHREAIVPLVDENEIKARLFRMSINGDVLISEERLVLDGTDTAVVVFDKIRCEFAVEFSDLTDFNSIEENDQAKILQVKIGKFNRMGEYSLDYHTENMVQNVKLIHRLNTFILGKENLFCRLKEGNKEIAHSMIPKRNCREEFDFGNGLTASVRCKAQVCKFNKIVTSKTGELEVFIINANKLKTINGICDPYIKVFLNGEKIYKTEKKTKCRDPVFNESFRINVQKNADVLGFHVYSSNALSTDTLIHSKDISLLNVSAGYVRFPIHLDGEGATLQVIMNYKKGDVNKKLI